MPANPLALAQRSALRMNDDIGDLFAAVGNSEHPRGFVLTAYRNARRAMVQALREENALLAARDVFAGLRSTLRAQTLSHFLDAQALGMEEAARQLAYYEILTNPSASLEDRRTAATFLDAVNAKIDAQELMVTALLISGAQPEQIVGDEERAGILRPSDIVPVVASLTATLVWNSFSGYIFNRTPPGIRFEKQVIAALDRRTTDCCLRAHAQIQPLEKPFKLTGDPRFADYLDWTPFHYYCRSSVALYQASYDAGLTAQMRDGADWFLNERRQGRSPDRHPADAFG